MTDPTIIFDSDGVWCINNAGRRYGIRWDEIVRVTAHKLDGITEVYTGLELDFDFGEYIGLYAHWPGFDALAAELPSRLPGMAPDWYDNVASLKPRDPAVVLWRSEQ